MPDAPTIGTATAASGQVSVAFTAPSAVGDDPITSFGVSVFPATGTTRTFRVTVASGNLYGGGTGNVFYIDGVSNPGITLVKGFTPSLTKKTVVTQGILSILKIHQIVSILQVLLFQEQQVHQEQLQH